MSLVTYPCDTKQSKFYFNFKIYTFYLNFDAKIKLKVFNQTISMTTSLWALNKLQNISLKRVSPIVEHEVENIIDENGKGC